MFRLVPFKSLKEALSCNLSLLDLYYERLSSDSVLIQDSNDMVVERFKVDKLRELEQCNPRDIQFSHFSFIDAPYADGFYLDDNGLDIDSGSFLNDSIRLTTHIDNDDLGDIFNCANLSLFATCINSVHIKLPLNEFNLSLGTFYFESEINNPIVLLIVNNRPMKFLKLGRASDRLRNRGYFEVVQFCKVEGGFEMVLVFSHYNIYVGVHLTNDLQLISIDGLDCILNKDLNKKLEGRDMASTLAKAKLAGKLGDLLGIEVKKC